MVAQWLRVSPSNQKVSDFIPAMGKLIIEFINSGQIKSLDLCLGEHALNCPSQRKPSAVTRGDSGARGARRAAARAFAVMNILVLEIGWLRKAPCCILFSWDKLFSFA
ncbi:hypothetical protein EVAR_62076_1 [Eumeta japonica]|uniref:Uncharacterized protein n=1 Tax=Eumeta variegata TaxID=151549 RepID=A0A4C1Z3Y8_EUMVA|nr:hypothetical protein EVAR_62076_1 [Eumeta japonica]